MGLIWKIIRKVWPLILVAACRNDAITIAKTMAPEAECHAINTTTGWTRDDNDTAVCKFERAVWYCSSRSAKCEKLRDIPAEAK